MYIFLIVFVKHKTRISSFHKQISSSSKWKTSLFALNDMIQTTISLEMPVPSQGHYGFHSFPVVDWFCLFIYLWVLTFPLKDCSKFGNFVITLIYLISMCNTIAFRHVVDNYLKSLFGCKTCQKTILTY